jgi:lysophospholipase L1-like esterase
MVPPTRLLRRVPLTAFAVLTAFGLGSLSGGCTSATTASDGADDRSGVARAVAPVVSVESQTDSGVGHLADRPSTVAVVGDSITVASAERLDEVLSDLGLEVLTIDAQVGRRMTVGERDRLFTGADIVELVAHERSPELWVIALGTNDIGQYGDPAEVAEQMDALLSRLPAGAPVVWIDTWFRGREEQSEMVNEAVRSVIAARPDSYLVEWSDHAGDAGVLSGDGVHLTTGVGVERFAQVVASGVEAFIGPAD